MIFKNKIHTKYSFRNTTTFHDLQTVGIDPGTTIT